ncbi:agmatinase [Ferrimicrobium sp.]|uniref:agmatinase n=1 Tax=Ferrimicrobium sp. TaxID=2926050 RepID=UPI00261556B2|nr:agmatinase [Ferrimicrobium sp.]
MEPIGPRNSLQEPRFSNATTFARLPTLAEVGTASIALVGAPFDAGVSYRPGARFGPLAIRTGSQLLRPYDPAMDLLPFGRVQVADAGDMGINPFSIEDAIATIEARAGELQTCVDRLVTLGGDHTIALPLLRAVTRRHGPVALIHFDAHLDTWDTYFGAPYTHGTPFRRAFEEDLLREDRSFHVGTRGPLYGKSDLDDDAGFGFQIITSDELVDASIPDLGARIKARIGDAPVYLSIDIDVLDPSAAPGTGTPEAGGPSSRDILKLLRQLRGINLVGADLVEVSPSYDHAEITAIAASHIIYTMIGLMTATIG